MKYLIIILGLLFITSSHAENKYYFDAGQDREVVDVSGLKTLEQINFEKKGDFVDITAEVKAKREADKIIEEETKLQKEIENKEKKEAIKSKLGLADEDLEDLKTILR